MPCSEFVHLRLHTAYSLLEGAIKIADLVKQCQKMGMPAVAMTDTCNLFGALDFSTNCAQGGIQPIIGCQLAVSTYMPESITDLQRSPPSNLRKGEISLPDQIILLAQNKIGYDNLLQLVSKYHLEENQLGNSYISYDLLNLYGEGLIAFTGGPAGGVGKLLSQGKNKHAETLLLKLRDIFKDRLYVELMRHNLETERFIEKGLIDLAYEHGLPLIATNECYFISEDMYEAHDALICISESTYVDQSERRRLTPEHRLKSAEEMSSLFSDLPEAIENTILVAKRCATMAEPCRPLLPSAPKSKDDKRSDDDVLENLAKIGLEKRLQSVVLMGIDDFSKTEAITKPYHERLRFELDVIGEMGFSGYFLIVADFIRWAKAEGIPVGPGRGSGAGSVVAWALTITDLDPLKFGLLFERFLNPERISMPDFDIDFCQERRDEVIRYVQGKYGEDRVAQIITFGTLQPRAALRDVGRVLGMPYGQVDGICKLVPNNPANPTTLEKAIDDEPLLRKEVELNAGVARLLEISMKLEGLYRHASTHAAGVVIGDRPLTDLIPLYRDPRSDIPVTQFSMKWAEAAGLVKFDFLGLKTLTIFSTTQELLKQRNLEIDLNNLPLDDSATYEMLGRGETTGVFQLESSGMRDILRNMKPDSFEDIIAIVALYRPGPMDNIPSYIRRKHGTEEADFLFPSLEPILSETYGIMIYQEQVMQIAQELAGYTLGGA
ncbi:MAG TPA: DNA polymerase III subunit alpha, partial [Rhodospirillales bacterium]|nr:DNA polymerase III subunit alpha [Rhodospirillales bacterium]